MLVSCHIKQVLINLCAVVHLRVAASLKCASCGCKFLPPSSSLKEKKIMWNK